jgi:hypothetical protein
MYTIGGKNASTDIEFVYIYPIWQVSFLSLLRKLSACQENFPTYNGSTCDNETTFPFTIRMTKHSSIVAASCDATDASSPAGSSGD